MSDTWLQGKSLVFWESGSATLEIIGCLSPYLLLHKTLPELVVGGGVESKPRSRWIFVSVNLGVVRAIFWTVVKGETEAGVFTRVGVARLEF